MVSYEEACEILGREAHERAAAFSIELVATSSAVGRVVATDVVLFDADLTKVAQVETVDSTISDISTNDLQSEQAVLDREEVIEPEPSIETIESPQMREINRPNIFVRKGESFSITDFLVSSASGLKEIPVFPRLTLGFLVVGDNTETFFETYAATFGILASEMGVVVSEISSCAAESEVISSHLGRMVQLDLDCIVVVSDAHDIVRGAADLAGFWGLCNSISAHPLEQLQFSTFRGKRSVLFSCGIAPTPFLASLRFVIAPYLMRVAGRKQRAPIKASLGHVVETSGERSLIVPGQLMARRGEFIVNAFVDSFLEDDSTSLEAFHKSSCWVVLPRGRTLFERGDLVDVEPLFPNLTRQSVIVTAEIGEGD